LGLTIKLSLLSVIREFHRLLGVVYTKLRNGYAIS
jgi:hypothetical protein